MGKKPSYKEVETRLSEYIKEITELKKKEIQSEYDKSRLLRDVKRYRALIEEANEIIAITDARGFISIVNKKVEEVSGYSREELIGKNVLIIAHPEDKNKYIEFWKDTLEGRRPSYELKALTKSGDVRHIMVSGSAIEISGDPVEIQCHVKDITDFKQTEEALRKSEEKFRVLVEKSPLAVSLINTNGKYEYINPKFVEIFGYELEDIPTGREWFRKAYPDREYRNQAITLWINDQKKIKLGESQPRIFNVTCKDGSEKIIHFRPMMMASGDQVVMYEDITETKRLEAQLQLAHKMEVVGVLAGGVAHDLNNILTGIVSFPDLLLMQLPKDSPLRKPIMTIQDSGNKAAAIVQDLLTLSRRGVTTEEVLNVNDIISEYMKSAEYEEMRSSHPNVTVKVNLAGDILNITGSRIHLSKTVMNLVSNAAEAMTDGGTILLSTENKYVDRPIKGYDDVKEGDYVILTVTDSGIGISPEDMVRIFDPFYTKKQMGRSGTGLGMTVIWGTMKDHKGYIDVQSAEGKGTTFTLYFPACRQQAVKDQPSSSVDDYMGRGETILVVDDIEEQRYIASMILSQLGYSVATVSSGEEAIDYAKKNKVNLLILDMIMDPGIDGLDTYKQILTIHPRQKAIISSGFSETKRVKEAQKLGAGQYIKKPYTVEKLGIAIREELER